MEPEDFKIGDTCKLVNRKHNTTFKGKLFTNIAASGGALFRGKDGNKIKCYLTLATVCDPTKGWEKA